MTQSPAAPPSARFQFFRRHWSWWFMVAVLLLVAAVRIRLLNSPIERDEGEYAYAGQLMLQGIPPYELAYNMKFPGTYAAYAFIMALFGETPAGIHFGMIIVTTLTALMLFWLGKKILDATAGIVAATFYAVLAASPSMLGLAGHATQFAAFFATAGLCVMWRARENSKWLTAIAAGILFGVAILMKQHAAFIALWAGIAFAGTCFHKTGISANRKFQLVSALGVGIVLPFGLCCLWLWHAGVFEKFWFWTIEYARQYATIVPSVVPLMKIHRVFLFHFGLAISDFSLLWLVPVAGLGIMWFDSRLKGLRLWLLGFCLAATATVFPGFYFRPHYFLLMLPALALLAGCAVSSAGELWRKHGKSSQLGDWPVWGYALIVAVAILEDPAAWFVLTPVQMESQVYGVQSFSAAEAIAALIRTNSAPDARVAVLGSEPEIYFLSRRHSATGYIYTYGLMEPQLFARRMQDEMIREVEGAAPEFVVFADDRMWNRRSDSDPEIFNWWDSYRTNYTRIALADLISASETRYAWGEKELARYGKTRGLGLEVYRRNKSN
jgi:4-amino-4-deoxy-L-arabinose transferase-like glycosyltransferase